MHCCLCPILPPMTEHERTSGCGELTSEKAVKFFGSRPCFLDESSPLVRRIAREKCVLSCESSPLVKRTQPHTARRQHGYGVFFSGPSASGCASLQCSSSWHSVPLLCPQWRAPQSLHQPSLWLAPLSLIQVRSTSVCACIDRFAFCISGCAYLCVLGTCCTCTHTTRTPLYLPALYACTRCLLYMPALYACAICLVYMPGLYACAICLCYMPALYAWSICLLYMPALDA